MYSYYLNFIISNKYFDKLQTWYDSNYKPAFLHSKVCFYIISRDSVALYLSTREQLFATTVYSLYLLF